MLSSVGLGFGAGFLLRRAAAGDWMAYCRCHDLDYDHGPVGRQRAAVANFAIGLFWEALV